MKNILRLCFALFVCWSATAAETPPPAEAESRANLKRLSAGIRAYGAAHDDRKPGSFRELLDEDLVDGPQFFSLDGAGAKLTPAEIDARGDYTMEPSPSAPDAIVREKKATHTPGKILAGFKDGSIKLVDVPVEAAEVRPAPAAPVVPVAPVPPRTEPVPVTPVVPVTPIAAVTPALPVTPIAPVIPPAVVVPAETTRRLPEDLLRDGGALLGSGRVAEARDRFKEVLTMQAESVDALKGLAQSQNLLGEIDAALATYRTLARVAPATANLRTWQAELAIAKGEFAEARSLLDAELKAQPRSAWAMSWLGTLELEAGNSAAARRHLQLAAQLDATVVGQRQANMQWLGATNQPVRVLRESQAVLQMSANHAGAIFAEADSRAKLGQPREAIAAYERYLRIDGASEWAAKARAEIARLKSIRAN